MAFKDRLSLYYQLAKPGIIYGNLVTAVAGFLLAAKGNIDWVLFPATVIGTALIIGSACVFNNYLDQNIDKRMARTRQRALVSGLISPKSALIFANTLGITGFLILAVLVNLLVVVLGLLAVVFYVAVYGFAKRRSAHGALVGSLPGAAPPVMGYCAVTGHIDGGAILLFLILIFWQMPHFYGIALYRMKEYKEANVPVMPLKAGVYSTQRQALIYMVAFLVAVYALWATGYASSTYLVVVMLAGIYWLFIGLKGLHTVDSQRWGRQIFLFSLALNLIFSMMIAFNWLWVKV